jgi:hypothetical protein
MGFTVEEQILAVVVGILATFLANKLGADGSSSGASMKSNLKEIISIQTELANAGADIVEALKEATAKGQALFAAGDKGGLASLAEKTSNLKGAFLESYFEKDDTVDPDTVTLPLGDLDARSINLGTKDELVRELNEEVTMQMVTVERVKDIDFLKQLPKIPRDPYYKRIYLKSENKGNVYVVVVNTKFNGVAAYEQLSYQGVNKVYMFIANTSTYNQLKKGECKILFTTDDIPKLSATSVALKYGVAIAEAPERSTDLTWDKVICYEYTGVASVKA